MGAKGRLGGEERILLEPHVVEGYTKHDGAEDEHACLAEPHL